jgi:hypothetical protein
MGGAAADEVFLSGAGLAAGIAWINSIGNLGGFFGPWYVGVMKDLTGSYAGGLYCGSGCEETKRTRLPPQAPTMRDRIQPYCLSSTASVLGAGSEPFRQSAVLLV